MFQLRRLISRWRASALARVARFERSLGYAHLLSQKLWRVTNTPNHTKAPRIGDSSGKLRTRCNVHPCEKCELSCSRWVTVQWESRWRTCEKDGVFDTEQLGDRCRDDGHSD